MSKIRRQCSRQRAGIILLAENKKQPTIGDRAKYDDDDAVGKEGRVKETIWHAEDDAKIWQQFSVILTWAKDT